MPLKLSVWNNQTNQKFDMQWFYIKLLSMHKIAKIYVNLIDISVAKVV